MSKVISIDEAKTPRRAYVKDCANWGINTLKAIVEAEQEIISELEDILQCYENISTLEKEGDTEKLKNVPAFENESIDIIKEDLAIISDIVTVADKYKLIQKEDIKE